MARVADSHTPGQGLTHHRTIDTQAVQSRGCTVRTDHDHGENYDGESALWPSEVEYFLGDCPACGAPTAHNGFAIGCVFCSWTERRG